MARQEEIDAAMAARPKVRIIGAYGKFKVGEIISPSPAQRAFLINNGLGQPAGKEPGKKSEDSKKGE